MKTWYVDKCFSLSVISNSLQSHGLQPARLLCSWDSPGKSTGVGCHFLFWGIFPTQGLNPGLLHWQADSSLSEPPRMFPGQKKSLSVDSAGIYSDKRFGGYRD